MNWSGLLKRVPAFALFAVAVWLLGRIALSAWELAQLEPPAPLSAAAAAGGGNPAPHAPGSGLFGTPGVDRGAAESPGLLSGGDFRLRGVVASTQPGMAHAIIESGGVPRAYFPGESLAAGLTLHEVRPYEVRLQRGAEILRLPLSGLKPGPGRGPAPGPSPSLGDDASANILLTPQRRALSQILRMEPVMDSGGSMQGYRIFPRDSREYDSRGLFDSLGLVSGDLLVAVNGVPVDSDNLPQAQQLMSAGGDMMLTVNRGGEQLEISAGSVDFGLLAM